MKFSILISSYNKGNYIDKCIKSCLSQSNKNLEIIVFDNYSSDETEKLLEKYSNNIIIKKKSKISKYPAVNQIDLLEEAFKISSGEIICLLDADDYFFNKKLETEYTTLLKDPYVSCVYSNHVFVDEIGNRNGLFSSSNDHPGK